MIVFDLEVNTKTNAIEEIGAISSLGELFIGKTIFDFIKFINKQNERVFAGHNVISFDLKHIKHTQLGEIITEHNVIDTLYLSALLFPKKPYHNLVKDDKIFSDSANNPGNDSRKSETVLNESINAFNRLNFEMQNIFYCLLKDVPGLIPFFQYINFVPLTNKLEFLLKKQFNGKICFSKNIMDLAHEYPFELALVLSYINTDNTAESILPPWVLNHFSKVEEILITLRNSPCNDKNCIYCSTHLDALEGLKKHFGYSSFVDFDGDNLQEQAVKSALLNESLIAVFPTGGGKSLTFQLPALMTGENIGGLTVVISPLQSLMKDQVDNLEKKKIFRAEYINGLQNLLERKKAIENVSDGSVSLLYIAPESLRSKTVETLLLKRNIVRFVIDEAHCFSSWGHDFRPDYLYIGKFIKSLNDKKKLKFPTPVSCFTATAKTEVIDDIKKYFKVELGLQMQLFKTKKGRDNLSFHVHKIFEGENRYIVLRDLIDNNQDKPIIIYASRVKNVNEIHNRLAKDGKLVSKFHGKMEADEKIQNQQDFMNNKTKIMVATNAFGMGVDKNDIAVIVHYDISSSLENYIQEAGRAARSKTEKMFGECHVLYNEDDLDKHFNLLNTSKVSQKEITQIWSGIKKETKEYTELTKTTFELAAIAGWGESSSNDVRVRTAILSLEDNGFITRGLNSPRIYATSILVNDFEKAREKIQASKIIPENEKENCISIIRPLIANKRKSWMGKDSEESSETRIDVLSDRLGLSKENIVECINYLKEEKLLADQNDLYAKISDEIKEKTLLRNLDNYFKIISFFINKLDDEEKTYNIKNLLVEFQKEEPKTTIKDLNKSLKVLVQLKIIQYESIQKDIFKVKLLDNKQIIEKDIWKFLDIAKFIIHYLIEKFKTDNKLESKSLIDFSSFELKQKYLQNKNLLVQDASIKDVEKTLLLLITLAVLTIEGGFLVAYTPITIKRLIKDNSYRYSRHYYRKLSDHYDMRYRQIHVVGHYAELLSIDKEKANEFVSDYFNLPFSEFINKHFSHEEREILNYKMSKKLHNKLIGNLSDEQKEIINDDKSKIISVFAGPGSGKTKLLVHKLASIIYQEDIRTDQLLMLTFSRNAAIEFKSRLKQLIGEIANYITITTFHSFCFDLLGRSGTIDTLENIVKEAVNSIQSGEIESSKITKMMIVVDEAQDMSEDEYNLIKELIKRNEDLRLLAVGDDDQNIYQFRGSRSKFLWALQSEKKYELSINFRSKGHIVEYANETLTRMSDRFKKKIIKPFNLETGVVELHYYKNKNLIIPVVNKVVSDQNLGTTIIMTKTNEEAALVSGVLTERKIKHKLVQDLSEVRLFNIFELRTFYNILSQKTNVLIDKRFWYEAMDEFDLLFKNSVTYNENKAILNIFFDNYKNPYIKDLEEFLLEYNDTGIREDSSLVVTNLHKAKGLEFDNVYILYEYQKTINNDELRLFYVGLTRAKSFLSIHTTNNYLKTIKPSITKFFINSEVHEYPKKIEMVFTLKDVHLDYYEYIEQHLKKIIPGDTLVLEEDKLKFNNKKVGRISKHGLETINQKQEKRYDILQLEVANLVYWYQKIDEKELLVLLPKITMVKKDNLEIIDAENSD